MPLAALSISAFFLTLPHHVPTTLSPFSTSYDSCAGLLRMVHFALLLLLAQAFLHSGGVMPQQRVDFYYAVLKASGMATFPETEEEVVAALLKAYEKTKLAKCFDPARGTRQARFKINNPGILFNGEFLEVSGFFPFHYPRLAAIPDCERTS